MKHPFIGLVAAFGALALAAVLINKMPMVHSAHPSHLAAMLRYRPGHLFYALVFAVPVALVIGVLLLLRYLDASPGSSLAARLAKRANYHDGLHHSGRPARRSPASLEAEYAARFAARRDAL